MSSFTFGQKVFTPTPPEKGSFPLDHDGNCKKVMLKYLICLNTHNCQNSMCRVEAKNYFQCRMDNNLMAKEDWTKLGYSDLEKDKDTDS